MAPQKHTLKDLSTVAIAVIIAAALFLGAAELVLTWGGWHPYQIVRLEAGDTISLLSGAVSCAALSAIAFQVVQSSRQAQEREEDDRENSRKSEREAAILADQLQAEFNGLRMQHARDRAWPYVKALIKNPKNLSAFAASWVFDESKFPAIPGVESGKRTEWAVSSMIAFFVRLENHFTILELTHPSLKTLAAKDRQRIAGPFFWDYWRVYLMALVKECDHQWKSASPEPCETGPQTQDSEAVPAPQGNVDSTSKSPFIPRRPYFVQPLFALDKRLHPEDYVTHP